MPYPRLSPDSRYLAIYKHIVKRTVKMPLLMRIGGARRLPSGNSSLVRSNREDASSLQQSTWPTSVAFDEPSVTAADSLRKRWRQRVVSIELSKFQPNPTCARDTCARVRHDDDDWLAPTASYKSIFLIGVEVGNRR
jgi:hypothetical protein